MHFYGSGNILIPLKTELVLSLHYRDEIYCQICKQINGNPSEKVRKLGWSLLACCLSSFPPSDEVKSQMSYRVHINVVYSWTMIKKVCNREKQHLFKEIVLLTVFAIQCLAIYLMHG
jgi:hypothetical protein